MIQTTNPNFSLSGTAITGNWLQPIRHQQVREHPPVRLVALQISSVMADSPEVGTPTNLYEVKPTLSNASRLGLQSAAVGAFVSALQNALGTHSRGAMGFLTRTGGTIGFFGVYLYSTLRIFMILTAFGLNSCYGIHFRFYRVLCCQRATEE
jgi:hypothetical protein